jgi:hypothetical protein
MRQHPAISLNVLKHPLVTKTKESEIWTPELNVPI